MQGETTSSATSATATSKTRPIPELPPASALLEQELRGVVKERGLVLWLDSDGNYGDFVTALVERAETGAFPFPVLRFEGSFLELMLGLEGYGNGLQPEKVLVYLPGFNTTSVAETPLYELYKAGRRFEKGLDTLIEQASAKLVRPEQSVEFRKKKPSLAEADVWLAAIKASEKNPFLLGLEQREPSSVLSELFAESSNLLGDLQQSDASGDQSNAEQFIEYLARRLGLPRTAWQALLDPGGEAATLGAAGLRNLVATWLMAVEFTTDLREAPKTAQLNIIAALPKSIVKLCHELVEQLRLQCPDQYRALSAEFEGSLEQDSHHAADKFGSIDTFRFEERAIRRAAVQALAAGDWVVALNFARERSPERCFWVRLDQRLERTWQLIQSGAAVGRMLTQSSKGLKGCASLEEATYRYRDTLFEVDQAHREFEQNYHLLYSTELEDDEALRQGRKAISAAYRQWADGLTQDFCKLCEEQGPLPGLELRQRSVYERFVHPIIERGQRVAVFLVDAMRFEMGDQLRRFFCSKKYKATLDARLAELPTVTEVGMNALAPVSQHGRLRLVHDGHTITGFRSGDKFTVMSPETRVKAMASRSTGGNQIDLELGKVLEASPKELEATLRRANSSKLVVVRSLELDLAGEKGFHLGTFDLTLQQLREAVQKLNAAGIAHFVLVADHGFLLQDTTAKQETYADAPKRRHVLTTTPSGKADALELPLSALDYDTDVPGYLVFRRDTAVWKTQEKIAPFVHGGNSLQERVIPVLTLEKQAKTGTNAARYEVIAKALSAEGPRRQRLSLQLRLQRRSTGELSFAGPRTISLALRVVGRDALPQVLDVTPPGKLDSGSILVPPGLDASTVTFFIEGDADEKVRVEVYHPDATERVEPAIVEGWFDLQRNRRTGKLGGSGEHAAVRPASDAPPAAAAPVTPPTGAIGTWQSSFDDAGYAEAFEWIERQETVSEVELGNLLGSSRRVRFFSLRFDELKKLVPFEVEITVVEGMKTYVKGGKR